MRVVRREIFKTSFRDGLYTYQKWALQSERTLSVQKQKNLNTLTPDEKISTANGDYVE